MLRILNLTLNRSSQRVDRRKWHQFHSVQSMVTPGAKNCRAECSWQFQWLFLGSLTVGTDGLSFLSLKSWFQKLLSTSEWARSSLVREDFLEHHRSVIASIICRLTRRFSPKHQLQKWQPSQLPHAWISVSSLQRPSWLMCRCLRAEMSRQPLASAYCVRKSTCDLRIFESVGGISG